MVISFKKHLLIAGGLLVLAVGWIGLRNWDAVSVMIDNASALNEGGEAAAEIRSPDDLLAYLSRHPETVSLAVYDAARPDEGLFVRADTPRAVPTLPKLQVALAYHRRVEAGAVDPDRPVPIDSIGVFSLPGITADGHERAVDSLSARGVIAPDSTVALKHWAEAALTLGDAAALDWLLVSWGEKYVRTLPERTGEPAVDPPQPATGRYLAWMDARRSGGGASAAAPAKPDRLARAFAFANRLRADAAYRSAVRDRLEREGSGLRLREQADLAADGFSRGTARAYASLVARIATGDDPAAEALRRTWETPVGDDSAAAFTHLASRNGAYPGLLAFAGYARRGEERSPRVAVMMVEDLPLAVLYHLLQTGIHKGFQLQLLGDEAFAGRVRAAFGSSSASETPAAVGPAVAGPSGGTTASR
jgi:hypothetical protein